jgi:hypothetical protein
MVIALGAIGALGAGLLRGAWLDRARVRSDLRTAGWAVFAIAVLTASLAIGPILGLVIALVTLPVGALAVVGAGATRREGRNPRNTQLAREPLQGPSKAWRGWLKFMLAGPLGMFAAMGVAFAYASWAPGAIQTRLLVAALLMPALWGLAMTWTLADQRIIRAAAVLIGAIAFGFGFALLGGIA